MLLNKKSAAEYLGISIESLDKRKDNGQLGFVLIGRRVLFTQALLDQFVEKCVINATKPPSRKESLTIVNRNEGGAE